MLSEAVLAIAEEMEKEVDQVSEPTVGEKTILRTLLSYAKQLRIAVKAAGRETTRGPEPVSQADAEAYHRTQIEKAKAEFRKSGDHVLAEERSPRAVTLAGTDVIVTVEGSMPEGAFTQVGDKVYQLKGNELHPVPDQG